jgi:hypothetical protein
LVVCCLAVTTTRASPLDLTLTSKANGAEGASPGYLFGESLHRVPLCFGWFLFRELPTSPSPVNSGRTANLRHHPPPSVGVSEQNRLDTDARQFPLGVATNSHQELLTVVESKAQNPIQKAAHITEAHAQKGVHLLTFGCDRKITFR